MNAKGGWLVAALLAMAALLAHPRVFAATLGPTVTVKWNTQSIVSLALTPNYCAGYGTVPAVIGTQPAPNPGGNASPNGGSVDFGTISAGSNYIYKYAVHVKVSSTDNNGINLYGEGAANFFNLNDSTSVSVSNIYWLNSVACGSSDTNTGFTAATPFQLTSGAASPPSFATPPTITYAVYPAPITTSSQANPDFYFDYQLKVPATATTGKYFVWIVYTAVGR